MARYIDADKLWNDRPLIPEGKSQDYVAGFSECMWGFSKRIKEQIDNPAADIVPKSEWISVEERLPTDEKCVLAYYGFDRSNGDLGRMYVGVLCYFAYDPIPHWQHESTGLKVTRWMPLPEPPKKKGGE